MGDYFVLSGYFGVNVYIVAVFLPRQSAELAEVWGRLLNPLADVERVLEKAKWLASLCWLLGYWSGLIVLHKTWSTFLGQVFAKKKQPPCALQLVASDQAVVVWAIR